MKGIICDILTPPPPVQSSYSRTMGNYMVFTAVAMRRHKFPDHQPQTQVKSQRQPKRLSGPQQVPQRQLPQ